ncbi:MAG: hypothetical protein IJ086_00650 [Clostridium sp.]|nr:hypothetical protein [Clostridium sp.]
MNKKNLILVLGLVSSTALVGCSKDTGSGSGISSLISGKSINVNNIKLPAYKELKLINVVDDEDDYYNYYTVGIEGYDRLKSYYEEDNNEDDSYYRITEFLLPGYPASPGKYSFYYESDKDTDMDITKYYVINNDANKIKSLLGKDVKLVPLKKENSITSAPEQYFVKGYEDADYELKDKRYILVNLQEKNMGEDYEDENFHPVEDEKITFVAESTTPEKALKIMLSMKKEIKEMLNNLLIKEDAEEVYRMLEDEIGRNNANPKESKSFNIEINDGMSIYYSYEYYDGYDGDEYRARLDFISEGDIDLEKYASIDNKPNDLKELVFANYEDANPNTFYLNPNFSIISFEEELLAKVYKEEISSGAMEWDGVSEIEHDIYISGDEDKSVSIEASWLYSDPNVVIEAPTSDIDFGIKEARRVLDEMFVINPKIVDIIEEKVREYIKSGNTEVDLEIELDETWSDIISLTVINGGDGTYEIVIG